MPEENKPAEMNLIERTELAVKNLKEQNDRTEELVRRNEEASSRMILGGGTTGNIPAEKPKEETAKEYADRVMHNQVK